MLDVMGQNIHLVGPTGAGATIKLVNQMMNFINAAGAVEGLILATKAGIDPELAYEILRTSSGASRSLDNVAQGGRRSLRADRRAADGGRSALVRGVELGVVDGGPLPAQPRVLARRRLGGWVPARTRTWPGAGGGT